MGEVLRFFSKGIFKSKYFKVSVVTLVAVLILWLAVNYFQPNETLEMFEKEFTEANELVANYVDQYYYKQATAGLDEEEAFMLERLLVHESHLKNMLKKIRAGQYDFVDEHQKYVESAQTLLEETGLDLYRLQDFSGVIEKINVLQHYNLPYMEEQTPFNNGLFTKQMMQIFFNPITAFIFLLAFIYKYLSDREQNLFDFLKLQAQSPFSIYTGYLLSFLLVLVIYVTFTALLAFLPTLLTGNLATLSYPSELVLIGKSEFSSVFMWLLYLPMSWLLFVTLSLFMLIALLRVDWPIGYPMTIFGGILASSLAVYQQYGFLQWNPLHLLVNYETHLFPTNQYGYYLMKMLMVLLLLSLVVLLFLRRGDIRFILRKNHQTTHHQYEPKKHLKLVQFERLKAKRKSKSFLTFCLLIAVIGGSLAYVQYQYITLPSKYAEIIDGKIAGNKQGIANGEASLFVYETELAIAEETGTESTPGLIEAIEDTKAKNLAAEKEIQRLEKYYEHIDEADGIEQFRREVLLPEFELFKVKVEEDLSESSTITLAGIDQQRIIAEQGIIPWHMNYELNTAYHKPDLYKDNETSYEFALSRYHANQKYDRSALFFLYKFFEWQFTFVVFGIFLFFLWTSMAEEYHPTITRNFLLTKPLSLKNIYRSKWAYNMGSSLSIFFSVLIIFIGVGWLLGGLGEKNYPMLVYLLNRTAEGDIFASVENIYFNFQPLWVMVLKCICLLIAQLFFLNGLFSLVGKWLTNHYGAIMVTFLFVVSGYLVGQKFIVADWAYLNPFVYFQTWHVVDGWLSIQAHSTKINALMGSVLLFGSGVVLFLLGLIGKVRR